MKTATCNTYQRNEFDNNMLVERNILHNLNRYYTALERVKRNGNVCRKLRLERLIRECQIRLDWSYYSQLTNVVRSRKTYDHNSLLDNAYRLRETTPTPTPDVQIFPELWNDVTKYVRKPVTKLAFRKSNGKELTQHYRQSMLPAEKSLNMDSMSEYCEPIVALREIETFQTTNIPVSEFIDGKFRDRKREECYKGLSSLKIKTVVTSYYMPVINPDNGSWSINQIQRIDTFQFHGYQIIRVYSRESGRFALLDSGKLAPIGIYQFTGVDNAKRLEKSRLALLTKKAKKLADEGKPTVKRIKAKK